MSLIYRPIRQYMLPQNIAINPDEENEFSLKIAGTQCVAYRFSVYDFNNNKITPPSTTRVNITTLYDGDTLEISATPSSLTAGTDYKWQVDLYGNNISVSSINTGTDVITATNHNFKTGDMVYIQSTSAIPTGLSAFTGYYVRKLSADTLSLYPTLEGAKSGGTAIDITSAGTGTITLSNVAISEQIPFYAFDEPTLVLSSTPILTQSWEFIPTYSHSQNVSVNKFNAYLYNSDGLTLIDESDEVYSANVKYTFDGLLSGESYKVRFIAVNDVGQTCDTGLVLFEVDYDLPTIDFSITATNIEEESCIEIEWGELIQITGQAISCTPTYQSNFIENGNFGLSVGISGSIVYENLDINSDSTFTILWLPDDVSFSGNIFKFENTQNGNSIIVGYDGTRFFRNINGTVFAKSIADTLVEDTVYLIGLTGNSLIINSYYNIP